MRLKEILHHSLSSPLASLLPRLLLFSPGTPLARMLAPGLAPCVCPAVSLLLSGLHAGRVLRPCGFTWAKRVFSHP